MLSISNLLSRGSGGAVAIANGPGAVAVAASSGLGSYAEANAIGPGAQAFAAAGPGEASMMTNLVTNDGSYSWFVYTPFTWISRGISSYFGGNDGDL